jgi:prevent-host-death family protein
MESVGIADLKSRLSEYLRKVRGGRAIVVLDRDRPIARIVPYEGERAPLKVRSPAPGAPPLHRVPLPPPLDLKIDPVALLLEERQSDR